jgi:DNA polymerase-1
MGLIILPDGFESGSRIEQITYLLDLAAVLHPCYGPKSKCVSPGKQPRWPEAGRLSASRLERLEHFKSHPNDNVGLVPLGDQAALDPDLDKKLKATGNLQPLEDWRLLYARLFEYLHVFSWRGFHHHLLCTDIPVGQGKISVPNYLPGLSLDIFIGPKCNIIIPPSVHPSGHIYRWGGTQEPQLSYQQLLERLRVDGNGAKSQQPPRHDDGAWKSAFKGDLRTLAADELCKALGLYGRAREDKERPAFTLRCPWGHLHSEQEREERWTGADTGTMVFWGEGRILVFDCKHDNTCSNHKTKEFLLWCEEQEPGIVDRHCRRTYQPPSASSSQDQEESVDWVREPWAPSTAKPQDFEQKIYYPKNSILHPFMEFGRTQTEGSDAYLLGSILAVCAALIGRRVYIDFSGPRYLNLFNLIVGKPGDRKSFTISLASRVASICLAPNRFLPPILSVEGLFDEYCEDCGGNPDKLCIVDDAAILLSTWQKSSYGERVADQMLRLYDGVGLTEAFRRNKKERAKTTRRTIPQTSTTLLLGATFADALFPKQKAQQGLARRFLYYLASSTQRLITWPKEQSIAPVAELFKPLMAFKGSLVLEAKAESLWETFQRANRARAAEAPDLRPDLACALSAEPLHVLKIAAIFELACVVAKGFTSKHKISAGCLELAIAHVAENLRASDYLFHRAQRIVAAALGEEILAKVRIQFPKSRRFPDTIFLERTRLTSTFCHNTARRGALTTEELYLNVLPELIRQGQAQLCVKRGKFELYAFRVSDLDAPNPGPPAEAFSPLPSISTGGYIPTRTYFFLNNNNIREVVPIEENGENGEIAPSSPRDVNLLSGTFALDLETCAEPKVARRGVPKITATREALSPWKGEIRLLTLADEDGNIQSFDLRTAPLSDETRAAIERSTLIVHNAGFDLLFLKVRLGVQPASVFCTMTAARLLNPVRGSSNKLGSVLERYLGVKLPKEYGSSDWGAFVLTEGQLAYAQDDVRYLHRLKGALETELECAGLKSVFALEMNLIPIVAAMEHHGFAVDRSKLEEIASTAATEALSFAKGLRDTFASPVLNPESPSQLLEAFKAAGVDIADTAENTLAALSDQRAQLVLNFRARTKLEASIKGLLKALGPDGRIHARFNPIGSLAGRFSSSGPNLQNITRGALREAFVASGPDRVLVVADYSQIELRIGAWYAADQVMLEAFRAKKDLHRSSAARVLSKSIDQVTREDRQLAKAVNFGFLYGQGADGFRTYARTGYGIELSLSEADSLRKNFFATYRGLKDWHSGAWEKAGNGVDENCTILGRRLFAQGTKSWDSFQLHTNYVVQGSAADVLKVAMVKLAGVLPTDVALVATVHDELIFDVPLGQAAHYQSVIVAAMKDAFTEIFGPELPVEVEAKICENWAKKDQKAT